MNITQFIKSSPELNELPFLIVYQTISILSKEGLLKVGDDDVGEVQPESPRKAGG